MVNDTDGILRSLDKTDPLALSTHLQEKFALRGIFLHFLQPGATVPSTVGEKKSRDDRGRTIPHALMENIVGYAGMPVETELRQLRSAREILPITICHTIGDLMGRPSTSCTAVISKVILCSFLNSLSSIS